MTPCQTPSHCRTNHNFCPACYATPETPSEKVEQTPDEPVGMPCKDEAQAIVEDGLALLARLRREV